MKLNSESKKVPLSWLKNGRTSEIPQTSYNQVNNLPRQSLSPIRRSEASFQAKGLNASFTPDSRFFDVTQKQSFMNVSKPLGVTQYPLKKPGDNIMGQSSMNISRNFLNQSIIEPKQNKQSFIAKTGNYQRQANDTQVKEIVDNRIQILDSIRNRLKEKRKTYVAALIVFLSIFDYFLISLFKWLIDGEPLLNARKNATYFMPLDTNIYYIIAYKITIYFLILKLAIDTDFYQFGACEALKKTFMLHWYPLISIAVASLLLYFKISLWGDILSTHLNPFNRLVLTLFSICLYIKILIYVFFASEGKYYADFTKRTLRDFLSHLSRITKSSIKTLVVSMAIIFLTLRIDSIIQPQNYALTASDRIEVSWLFLVKIYLFLFIYCYVSLDLYLFVARIFLITDFKNYFPNYKGIRTVFKLYHEIQVDSYARDLDKFIIEKDILKYLRDNLSVLYNNFFKFSRGIDNTGGEAQNVELNWKVMNQIFSLEMRQLDEIFMKSARGRSPKYFDMIDSVMYFFDYLFVNDRYQEAYVTFNSRVELLLLKFEFLKELYIFSFADNSEKASFEETQQLYKHLRSIYDNMMRFLSKFAETKTNYTKTNITFVFERLIDALEDLLQKMSICIEGTSFKGNLVY